MTHMTNFRGEDMKVSIAKDSKKDDSSSEQSAPPPEQEPGQQSGQESGQPPEQDEEQKSEEEEEEDDKSDDEPVPDGTTAEILRWVGDDRDRAQRALDKEQANDRPRAGLTGELKKILGE